MKLNLLPTSVSRGAAARTGVIFAIVLVAVAIFGALTMMNICTKQLADAKNEETDATPKAELAVKTANEADTVLTTVQGPLLNLRLAQAMDSHNAVYPTFYDKIIPYIPSYFRLTSIQATPDDANTCTVTLNGTLGSFQQYADLMVALLRIPGSLSVSRAGYQLNDTYVPPLVRNDQSGRPIKQGEANLPDDPIERMNTLIAKSGTPGFSGAGNFGTFDSPHVRGAAPGESAVTVQVRVTQNLLTPNPRATLSGGAFGAAASGGAGGAGQ